MHSAVFPPGWPRTLEFFYSVNESRHPSSTLRPVSLYIVSPKLYRANVQLRNVNDTHSRFHDLFRPLHTRKNFPANPRPCRDIFFSFWIRVHLHGSWFSDFEDCVCRVHRIHCRAVFARPLSLSLAISHSLSISLSLSVVNHRQRAAYNTVNPAEFRFAELDVRSR